MSIDASVLQISVQEEERWRRRMRVTVPAVVVRQEEDRAAHDLASRARLKGFRKGRVPTKVIESRFGGTLRREALDKLIGQAYREALSSKELRPISEGEIEDISYEPEQDLVFSIAFDIQPEIVIERTGGFGVERPVTEITDQTINEVLGKIQEQNGAWKPVEDGHPEDRNVVDIHIRKLADEDVGEGKEYEFVLGQGDALPDIENAIKTLEPGASGEFEVSFPDDFPDESRRGETEQLEITLRGRKEMELPAIDDDLARQVGDFETLDALRVRVREDLVKDADQQAEAVVRGRLLDLVLDANPFEVPHSMVNRYIDGILGEQAEKIDAERLPEIKDSIRDEAERAVKRIMVIELLAEQEKLSATEDDIDARVEEIAQAGDGNPAKVYASLQKAGRLEQVERELTERKVFEFLKGQSEITDAPAA